MRLYEDADIGVGVALNVLVGKLLCAVRAPIVHKNDFPGESSKGKRTILTTCRAGSGKSNRECIHRASWEDEGARCMRG